MATIKWAVLLLFATSASAAAPDIAAELRSVRTVNVRTPSEWSPDHAAELWQKFDEIIPSLVPGPSEEADLVIEYSEVAVAGSSNAGQGTTWQATLFHLACQSPGFGEPPGPIVRGKCENNVFVRVGFGKLSGAVALGASATEDFAYALRDAILGLASMTSAPVPPLPQYVDGDRNQFIEDFLIVPAPANESR